MNFSDEHFAIIGGINLCVSIPPNRPLEWAGHRNLLAAQLQDPCLPLRGSVD
jgi:hypothetical protein